MAFPQKLYIILALLLTYHITSAQSMDKGVIKMELVDVKVSKPEMQQMVGAMKGSTQEISFDKSKQKVVMDMMGGMMKIQMYQDFDDQTMVNYMDMMGQKIKTSISSEELEKQKKASEEMMGDSKVVYDKSDTKEILGYTCHKASLETSAQGNKLSMTFYVTDDIQVPQAFIQNVNHINLKGTPLQWELDAGQMQMTYEAKEISEKVADDFFAKPSGDYKEMSMEQLQQMGVGGGQMGF
ncbi:MAG: hypothetical protein HKN87_00970 [Saprospiraceae bacterium]|nr:hypothetical protein [Saprospiraceae bacterium]